MSGAFGVSQDGLTVAGFSGSSGGNRAFRWTSAGGMENLGTLPGETQSWANGISADGSTIVGYSGSRAFRWNAAEGMVSLGAAAANAAASNKNGLVIVGSSGSQGFLWTPGLGMVDLFAFLPTLGISLTGWTGLSPKSISADGLTIVGSGTHNGVAEGWIATLGPRCLANCDNSFIPPALNVNDFLCFNNHFALGDPMANCDGSTLPPVLNVSDFVCFLNRYAAGCP